MKPTIAQSLLSENYVGSLDFTMNGKTEMEVEVVKVEMEDVFNPGTNKKDKKWVATLKPIRKRFILGAKANLKPMIKAFGGDETQWPGCRFTLYVGDWKGQPCLRVKDCKPK